MAPYKQFMAGDVYADNKDNNSNKDNNNNGKNGKRKFIGGAERARRTARKELSTPRNSNNNNNKNRGL
jgi:hypothetical protein